MALVLGGLFLACAIPNVTLATSYTVSTFDDEADSTPSCETGSSTDCSLREAIILANSGGADTIIVPAGTYNLTVTGTGENAAATGDLDFTDSDTTTITGAGSGSVTIDATNISDRIFDARSGSSVDISGVTIQNGSTSGAVGAGFYMLSATVVLDDVVVQDNVISDTSFEAVSQGAGVFVSGTTLTMTDSTITGNGAASEYVYGGGVYLSSDSIVDFDRVVISDNLTNDTGGGVYSGASAATTKTFTDVSITGNTAGGSGGGMYFGGGTGYPDVEMRNIFVSDNHSDQAGGGLYLNGNIELTNATISNNTADESGGGFYAHNTTYTDVNVNFSTITGNTADFDDSSTGNGGGIKVAGSDADVALLGTIIAGNTSNTSGQDCYADAGINTGNTYNLIGDTGGCTASWPGDTNVLNPASVSYIATATSADNGGDVHTIVVSSDDVTDVVPEADCDDAAGNPLTEDARGYARPENTNCDMGALELDQVDPTVSVANGTDTVECGSEWTDAGATVNDNFATGISATVSGAVDNENVGEYTVTYTGEDFDGNTDSDTRTVTVEDTTNPEVTITGEDVTMAVGDSYTDAGAAATDACDGSIDVTTSGTVDTDTVGEYTVTYAAVDGEGNEATATRTVTITEAVEEDSEEPVVSVRTNGKFVQVFEDGVRVQQKKIGPSTVKRKYRKILTRNLFPNKPYQNVVVLRVGKKKAKVVVFRLTENNRLRKHVVRTFTFTKRNSVALKVQRAKKRIIATVGKKAVQVKKRYRLKTNGQLKSL